MSITLDQSLNIASRRRRIAAFLIDHFVLTFLMVSAIFLAMGPGFIDDNGGKMISVMLAVMLPGFIIYFGKDSIKGISVGKWIMGIMIRDAESPTDIPTIGRLFLRNLCLLIWPVEFIVLAASQEKRRLGDKVARTIVVNNPNKPSWTPRVLVLCAVALTYSSFLVVFVGAAIKNSDAYKVAVQEIEYNKEIQAKTGGIVGYGIMPTGNVNISNGNGEAQLEINVIGKEQDLKVSVHLTKESGGKWKLIELIK